MITLKTADQIKYIGDSCRLLAQLLDTLDDFIEVGMTTKEIDKYCHSYIEEHKGRPAFFNYMGFPAATCISVNEEVIHGIPSNRVINKGDLVSIDLGIDLNGYYSDSARTYIVGKALKAEHELLVKVTKECLDLAINDIDKKNARINDISKAVFNHATKHNFGVVRDYCGHGVGLAVHEDPQIPNYINSRLPNPRLREGMVLAIEPMINLGSEKVRVLEDNWTVVTVDSSVSAHFEHTVAITKDGVQVLTVSE
jgi:methionyl aminopeptidase